MGWGISGPTPRTFLQLMILRRYFDNSQFIPSLLNLHHVSNSMKSYMASQLRRYYKKYVCKAFFFKREFIGNKTIII